MRRRDFIELVEGPIDGTAARLPSNDALKTPANSGAPGGIELMHVGRGTVVDTVSLSTVATDDVKISCGIELRALLRRQPASQKAKAASFTTIFTPKCPVELAQGLSPRPAVRRRSSKQHRAGETH
jgi:hypothetical protein